jgi:hypothetical protein
MDSSTIAIFAVAEERVFVVAAALTSIVLGWNLFTRAIFVNQEETVSIGDWKVELKAVGPGVFFFLFGTIALLYVLLRTAEYTVTKTTGNSGNQQNQPRIGGRRSGRHKRRLATSEPSTPSLKLRSSLRRSPPDPLRC